MKTCAPIFIIIFALLLASCAPASLTPNGMSTLPVPTETQPAQPNPPPTNTPIPSPTWVYLSDLKPSLVQVGYWDFATGKYPASEGSMMQGQVIHNGSQTYPHGLFAAAPSDLRYDLNGQYQTFQAEIFIDPSMICDADGALFQVYLDGELLYSQPVETPRQSPSQVSTVFLDVRQGQQLLLHADPGEKGDQACDATIWGEAALLTDPAPVAAIPPTASLGQQPMLARELERFTHAMRGAGALDAERSLSFADIQVASFRNLEGTTFETAFIHLDPDPAQTGEALEGDYPLLINEKGEWKKVGLRFWAQANQMSLALPLIANDSMLDDPTFSQELLKENATQIVVEEYIYANHIFADFTSADWDRVLADWDRIKSKLDAGTLPDSFSFQWQGIDRTLEVADTLGLDVRAANIFPDSSSVPQDIVEGQYQPEELEHFFEFMVKVPIVKYRSRIKTWVVVSESTGWLSSGRGPEKSWGFPYLQLGGVDIIEKAYGWASEVEPQATLLLADDYILLNRVFSDYGATQPHWNQVFFKTLSTLKARQVPVDALDIENNFWIYNPPDPEFMRTQLMQIQNLGYSLAAPEVTVLVSESYPVPSIQSQKQATVVNPLAAQALIYQQTLQVYLDLNLPAFGLGGLSDRFSFWRYSDYPEAHAMIFDYNQQPKAAYYVLVSTFYRHLGP